MTGREPAFRPKATTTACTDLDRSRRFYEFVLGAYPDPRDGLGCPLYRLGTERSPSAFPNHAMAILWLEAGDLESAKRRFAWEQVEVVRPSDAQFMMIADPDGLMIKAWQSG